MKAEWTELPFVNAISDESGGNIKTPQSEFLSSGNFAVVDQSKELISGYVDDELRLCKALLPVIIFGDHTRCFKFVDFPFCMGADGVKVLRPKVEADVKYLYYYLRQLNLHNGGYDRHYKYLKRSNVLLPPLEEQKRIAEILDRAESLRAMRRQSIEHLDVLSRSIFIEMFGDPRKVDKKHEIVPLSILCHSINDGTHKTPKYVSCGVPFVTVKNITTRKLDLSSTKFISQEEHEELTKRTKPEKGDILVSKDGTIGVPCPIQTNVIFSIFVSVALLKPKADVVDQIFLTHQLDSDWVQEQIRAGTKGIAIRHLHLADFKRLKIILPPLPLQQEFAQRIEAIEKLKATHQKSLTELDALFASLQHRAFRGEL